MPGSHLYNSLRKLDQVFDFFAYWYMKFDWYYTCSIIEAAIMNSIQNTPSAEICFLRKPPVQCTYSSCLWCLSYYIRYAINNECHLNQSTTFSADTCKNINGTYVAANGTCYYQEYSCPYYTVGGQCHPNVLCDTISCGSCHLYGGYYKPSTKWYVI